MPCSDGLQGEVEGDGLQGDGHQGQVPREMVSTNGRLDNQVLGTVSSGLVRYIFGI